MKNKIIALAIAASFVCFSSCKKCTTCEVKDGSGNVVYPAEETCGNDSQIEQAKDLNNTRAIIIGGTSSCIDK
jgi:NADH:ubiquinone oxidoreductase subunit F (NADH-binding)